MKKTRLLTIAALSITLLCGVNLAGAVEMYEMIKSRLSVSSGATP